MSQSECHSGKIVCLMTTLPEVIRRWKRDDQPLPSMSSASTSEREETGGQRIKSRKWRRIETKRQQKHLNASSTQAATTSLPNAGSLVAERDKVGGISRRSRIQPIGLH